MLIEPLSVYDLVAAAAFGGGIVALIFARLYGEPTRRDDE